LRQQIREIIVGKLLLKDEAQEEERSFIVTNACENLAVAIVQVINVVFVFSPFSQIAIVSTFLLAVALAEPPAPRSSYLPPQSRNNAPSNQYGAPQQGQGRSSFAAQPRTNYGAPAQAQQPRNNYGPPAQARSFTAPSSQYGAPAQAQQPRNNYGPPATSYGVPQAQDFNNFDSQRANSYQQAPSTNYGAPSGQDSYAPQQQQQQSGYGSGPNNGGYEEPAKYEFQYDVQDEQAGLDFGHKEQRDGAVATGKYYVLLPDGRKQVS